MIEFRESKPEDFQHMIEHSTNKTVDRKPFERVDYSYTLEEDGKPVGMGGFSLIVPETYWCWIDLTEDAEKNIVTCYRVIRDWMNKFAESMEIKRLQAFIKDRPRHIRLAEHLGFERESVMKNFYGNEDGFMYRKLF